MTTRTVEPNFKKPRTKAQRGMYGRGAKAKCLKMHSEIVRARGACEYLDCGSRLNLQCAHIIRRTFAWTATDETNAWCLCAKHHFLIDLHPDDFMEFVDQSIGRAAFNRLKRKARDGVGRKFDWDAEQIRLSGLLAEVQQ